MGSSSMSSTSFALGLSSSFKDDATVEKEKRDVSDTIEGW